MVAIKRTVGNEENSRAFSRNSAVNKIRIEKVIEIESSKSRRNAGNETTKTAIMPRTRIPSARSDRNTSDRRA